MTFLSSTSAKEVVFGLSLRIGVEGSGVHAELGGKTGRKGVGRRREGEGKDGNEIVGWRRTVNRPT